jgi:hypothetical protein
MTNTWKKLADAWCVQCPEQRAPGDVVTVITRSTGATKQVTLGANVQTNAYGFVYAVAQAPKAPAPQAQAVGELSGVLALFAKAKTHLKFPAIVLGVPEIDNTQDVEGFTLRLTIAGPRAKVPGSVTVTTQDRVWNRFEQEDQREWLGRVTVDGTYQPSRAANGRTEAIVRRLAELAANPAKVAAEHGRLTGRCCFCNTALSDERSTAVGYGPTCADHFGLPWGVR